MNKRCLQYFSLVTIGYIAFLVICLKYNNIINKRYEKVQLEKKMTEDSFLEAMKFNAKYIGDINVLDVYGNSLLLREISELKFIESKVVIFLRPTDCSICSNELMNVITKRNEDNKYIILTTNKNMASARVLTQKRDINVSIYSLSLLETSEIMVDVNSGPALFQLDRNCSILNLFITKNSSKELINKYLDEVM